MADKVQMTATVPSEMSNRLLEIAKSDRRFSSRSHIVTMALEDWLNKFDAENK